ncbi:MAG: hypothetical protein QW560_02395 [Candidatus Nitrosocaldus sp.]
MGLIVVEPSQFASSRLDTLRANIIAALDTHGMEYSIKQDGHLLILDVDEPVDAMYALMDVFGIRGIGIAETVDKELDSLVSAIVSAGKDVIHSNERFHVEVIGSANGLVARDVEFAATAVLISELSMLNVKPSSRDYDRLIRVYISDENAYVCRLYRDGADGLPVGSNGYALCSVYDCVSAVAAYMLAKHGFYPSIVAIYTDEQRLRRVARSIGIIARMLPRKSIELRYTYYTPKSKDYTHGYKHDDTLTVVASLLLDRLAGVSDVGSNNSNSIALPLSSSLHSIDFINKVREMMNCRNIMFPLMFSSDLLNYSKIFGVECVREMHAISRYTTGVVDDERVHGYVEECVSNMHTLEVSLNPNMVHDIIDGIRKGKDKCNSD